MPNSKQTSEFKKMTVIDFSEHIAPMRSDFLNVVTGTILGMHPEDKAAFLEIVLVDAQTLLDIVKSELENK